MNTKKALRKKLLDYRNSLSEDEVSARSVSICNRLSGLDEIQKANNIHCFWPITEKREIDTIPFIEQLCSSNKNVVLPVVVSFIDTVPSENRMEHRLYEGETNLITNRWGVKEPAKKSLFPVCKLDAVVVPALGVARNGYRLGYGKGYYDEFLSQCECPFICPVYSACLLESIPALPHDIPVGIIVTEHEVIRINL